MNCKFIEYRFIIFGVSIPSDTSQVQYVSSATNVISEGGQGGSSGEIYFYQRHHREKMLARRDDR